MIAKTVGESSAFTTWEKIRVFGLIKPLLEIFDKSWKGVESNEKLEFYCARWTHYSFRPFWAIIDYSRTILVHGTSLLITPRPDPIKKWPRHSNGLQKRSCCWKFQNSTFKTLDSSKLVWNFQNLHKRATISAPTHRFATRGYSSP